MVKGMVQHRAQSPVTKEPLGSEEVPSPLAFLGIPRNSYSARHQGGGDKTGQQQDGAFPWAVRLFRPKMLGPKGEAQMGVGRKPQGAFPPGPPCRCLAGCPSRSRDRSQWATCIRDEAVVAGVWEPHARPVPTV